MAEPIEEIKLYDANNNVVEVDDVLAVKAEKHVDGKITETATKNMNNEWDWTPVSAGGRKRRSSKKYKKGGNKHTMGGRKSKKCKKGGKRPKKTRKH